MNCIFCKKLLSYYRDSLRFAGCEEYRCDHCLINGIATYFGNEFSRCILHINNKKEIIFQDISIDLINMEHNYIENTTVIGEWKKVKDRIELITYVKIPLSINLNYLSSQDLRKKIDLYLTFS